MSEQLTDEQLAEIKARAAAATPGPWWAESVDCCVISEALGDDDEGGCWVADFGCAFPDDGEFIAHAREDIPLLVSEVERLREVLARADLFNAGVMPLDKGPLVVRVYVDRLRYVPDDRQAWAVSHTASYVQRLGRDGEWFVPTRDDIGRYTFATLDEALAAARAAIEAAWAARPELAETRAGWREKGD